MKYVQYIISIVILIYIFSIQYGRSPLLVACEGGHTETTRCLIDKGANVNMFDEVCTINKCSDSYTLFLFCLFSLVDHYF